MRNYIVVIFVSLLYINTSFAQEIGKLRVGFGTGHSFPFGGDAPIFIPNILQMELKYNFQKNMNVGLKTEVTTFRTCRCYDLELLPISITYDYYFHYKNRMFSPFIGAGLGFYFARGHEGHTETHYNYTNPMGFVRTGFEICKIRTSLAYNLVRKPQKYYNGNLDYVSFTVGFYIGGGKWKSVE